MFSDSDRPLPGSGQQPGQRRRWKVRNGAPKTCFYMIMEVCRDRHEYQQEANFRLLTNNKCT